MKRYERFAECLKRLVKSRKLSTAEFARRMGCKSRNSVSRILNDSVSSDLEAAFYADLKEKDVLRLSQEEIEELDAALEISRVGYSDHCSNEAIGGLLMNADSAVNHYVCLDVDAEGKFLSFANVMAEYAGYSRVEMLIFSCCNVAFCREIADSFSAANCVCQPEVTHYMHAGSDEIVQNVVAIQPLLYAPWYRAYFIEQDENAPETDALFSASFAMSHVVTQDGTDLWDEFLLVDGEQMCRIHLKSGGYFTFIKQILQRSSGSMHLVKHDFDNLIQGFSDYLKYVENYRLLEKNRDVYSLKPDVPVNFIHPDILLPSVMEGIAAIADMPEKQADQLVQKLYANHLFRWRNFFGKKKVTHIVFSHKAMERFVATGRQSDHFFAMRPYTSAERQKILVHLREQLANNPYFWIYLLNEESDPSRLPAEITFYDGEGVLFTKANTDYNLTNREHSEAMIDHPEFCRKYKSFFMKDLLTSHVLTYQETLAQFDEWIARLS